MKTNDFVKTILPVAADIVMDIIKDCVKGNDNVCIDESKSGVDVCREPDKLNVNVNLYVNVYMGLGERTRSISGMSYVDQY